MRPSTRVLAQTALLAGLTAVAAQVAVPLPLTAVPFTMQVLAVLLTGALLGAGGGAVAMGIYLLLGIVGVPVFAQFQGGLGPLLGPTGGYLWSFPAAAAVVGLLVDLGAAAHRGPPAAPQLRIRPRPHLFRIVAAMLAGLITIYLGGGLWAVLVIGEKAGVVFSLWVLPFIPLDIVKVIIAAGVARSVRAALPSIGRA